jgi:copper transport protein
VIRLLRTAVVAVLVAPLLLLAAGPALAHAALLSTDPQDGIVLEQAPEQVSLRFNQPVAISLGAVRVIDPSGARVDDGQPERTDGGKVVTVRLPDAGAEGTYVLTWRVVSQDAHPVSGVSTFSVGQPSEPAAAVEATGSGPAGFWLTVARLIGFVGLLAAIGVVAVLLLVWPQGRQRRSVRVLAGTGLALTALGGLAGLLLQGPNVAGLPVADAFDGALLSEVLQSRYGQAHVARLALLVPVAVGVVVLLRSRRPLGTPARIATAVLALPLLVTWPLSGHAAAGSMMALTLPADALHLAAVGAWTGGLAVLALALLRHPSPEQLTAALPRWSRLATVAVVVLVVTGLFASWREVGGLSALTGTTYGLLLVGKVSLVLLMLALGAGGRAWIARHYRMPVAHAATTTVLERGAPDRPAPPPQKEVSLLRRRVGAEAALAAVVIALTAVLVETPPARSAYAEPLSTIEQLGPDSKVQIDLDSAVVGVNTLHVYLTGPGGKAFDVPEVTARLSRPDGESLTSTVERKSLGHYETNDLAVPYRGTWRLDVTVRTSDFDAETATITTTFR